jgi:transcription antitermination factor NusG
MMAQWYVVMCGRAAGFSEQRRIIPEFRAVERIGDEGYEAFCPTLTRLARARHGQRQRERIVVPMWDGYIFARLDERALGSRLVAWRDKGEVWDVIRECGQPYPLRAAVIDSVRAIDSALRAADLTGQPVDEIARVLSVGDRVEHQGAIYQGLVGTITRVDRDNIEFLLELFGSMRTVRAKARDVEVVQ